MVRHLMGFHHVLFPAESLTALQIVPISLREGHPMTRFLGFGFDNPVNSSVLANTRSLTAVFASCKAKLILINAKAMVINPGIKIKLGK